MLSGVANAGHRAVTGEYSHGLFDGTDYDTFVHAHIRNVNDHKHFQYTALYKSQGAGYPAAFVGDDDCNCRHVHYDYDADGPAAQTYDCLFFAYVYASQQYGDHDLKGHNHYHHDGYCG